MSSKASLRSKGKTPSIQDMLDLDDENEFDMEMENMEPGLKRKKKKKRSRFFETYISKVLKSVSERSGIGSNAKQQLNSALCIISKEVSKLAFQLTETSKKKTISVKELKNAINIIFPEGKIKDKCIQKADNSVARFIETTKGEKNMSRQEKAGIIFPPSIIDKFLKNFGYYNIMITNTTPVFLASVLQTLCEIILKSSVNVLSNSNKVRLTVRTLYLGISNNTEMSGIFRKLKIQFLGGGVVPFIHKKLLVKKPRKKIGTRSVLTKDGKKSHRFRPGTVAIREIKKFQKKSDCLSFAKHPFEKYVREIFDDVDVGHKISKNVFIILQHFIEQHITEILFKANAAAIHAGRVKLMPSDISFVQSIST